MLQLATLRTYWRLGRKTVLWLAHSLCVATHTDLARDSMAMELGASQLALVTLLCPLQLALATTPRPLELLPYCDPLPNTWVGSEVASGGLSWALQALESSTSFRTGGEAVYAIQKILIFSFCPEVMQCQLGVAISYLAGIRKIIVIEKK